MLSFDELNKVWAKCLRNHALLPLVGEKGPYSPIGDKSLKLLDALWKLRKAPVPDVGALVAQGKKVRFWADPHWNHERIITLCSRDSFADVGQMDSAMWENVSLALSGSDLVCCLGDLAMKNPISWQRRLVADFGDRHFLVVGNHDAKGAKPGQWAAAGAAASFAFSLPSALIRSWAEEDRGDEASLVDWSALPRHICFGASHWPMPPARLPGPSWVCLHGHIHNRKPGPLGVNCSMEAVGYRPAELRALLSLELMDNVARRARDPHCFDAAPVRDEGDSEYL